MEGIFLYALLQREFMRADFCGFRRSKSHRLRDDPPDRFGDDRTYLGNGKARIFDELPLEFSNEAPALIWNLSLPTWPQT